MAARSSPPSVVGATTASLVRSFSIAGAFSLGDASCVCFRSSRNGAMSRLQTSACVGSSPLARTRGALRRSWPWWPNVRSPCPTTMATASSSRWAMSTQRSAPVCSSSTSPRRVARVWMSGRSCATTSCFSRAIPVRNSCYTFTLTAPSRIAVGTFTMSSANVPATTT